MKKTKLSLKGWMVLMFFGFLFIVSFLAYRYNNDDLSDTKETYINIVIIPLIVIGIVGFVCNKIEKHFKKNLLETQPETPKE